MASVKKRIYHYAPNYTNECENLHRTFQRTNTKKWDTAGLPDPRGAGSVPMAVGGTGWLWAPPPPTSKSRAGVAGTCTGDLHHSMETRVPRIPFHNIYINCFAKEEWVGITIASNCTVLGLLQQRLRHLPIVQYSLLCLLTNLF